MTKPWVTVLAGVAVVSVFACVSATGPGAADIRFEVVEIQSPTADDPGWVIEFKIENRGTESAYLSPRCGGTVTPLFFERQEGAWESVGGAICLAIFDMSPWELEAGETLGGSANWRFAGHYRFQIEASDRSGGESVSIRSEEFVLE